MLHDPRPPHLQRKAAEAKALHSQEHAAGWTEERIDLLKKRWGEGASAFQIALELGGGVTRSGVIGKVHRLKLGRKSATTKPKPAKRPKALVDMDHRTRSTLLRRNDAPPALPASPLPPEPEDGVDVTHLLGILQINEHTCKWPVGDPLKPGFGFCGQHSKEGSPYCEQHDRRAYIRL